MALQIKQFDPTKWKSQFFTVWIGQSFSIFGSILVQFVLIWWLTKQTGSAIVLATATIVGILPEIFIGPFSGALVDRWNRRLVLIAADGAVALSTLALAILFWVGVIQVWHVYLIMFIRALGGGFHWPAMMASTTLMVPKEHYSRIAGANRALIGILNIAGPPLGALLLQFMTIPAILSLDIVTAIMAIIPLLFIAIPQPERPEAAVVAKSLVRSVLVDVREGLVYVASWRGLLLVMVISTALNFVFNPAFALLPLLITKHFGGDAIHLAGMEAAFGFGVVAGGLLLGVWGGFKRKVHTSMTGLVGMSVGLFLIGYAPANLLWLASFAMGIVGFMSPILDGPLMAILQEKVDINKQGRVMSLVSSASRAATPISMIIAGPLADVIGIRVWYIAGGILGIVICIWGFFNKTLYHFETSEAGMDKLSCKVEKAIAEISFADK